MSIMGAASYSTEGLIWFFSFCLFVFFCYYLPGLASLLLESCFGLGFPFALALLHSLSTPYLFYPYGSVHVRPHRLRYGSCLLFSFLLYSNRSELWGPPLSSLGGGIIKQPWGKLILTIGLSGLGCFPHDEDPKAGFDNEEPSLCSLITYATSASQHLCQRVAIITALG